MNICIDKAKIWLGNHKKTKEWIWFLVLWVAGLLAVFLLSGIIKFIMTI